MAFEGKYLRVDVVFKEIRYIKSTWGLMLTL